MSTRKINYNNDVFYFDFNNFNELFNKEAKRRKLSKAQFEEILSNNIYLTKSAIHNWLYKKNGPSDLEVIKNIAKELKIKDISVLLTKKNLKNDSPLNDLQKMSIKKIYDSIIEFLDIFEKTNGFNDLWFDLKSESEERMGELYDIALNYIDKLHLILKKEYIFLKNTPVYDELKNFEYNDIYETFENKLTYGYRFEALVDGNPTTEDDYYKALNKLNSIIDKYL